MAVVANAVENTHSTFEGRDSGFSPAPKGTSSGIDPCWQGKKGQPTPIPLLAQAKRGNC